MTVPKIGAINAANSAAPKKIEDAAREFESLLIAQMLKSARESASSGLGEKDVHIIDPFTGTGTFIVRLLQSGLIPAKDLLRKYNLRNRAGGGLSPCDLCCC